MVMKNEKTRSKLIKEIATDNPTVLEHMERTEWKERHIIAWAKSIALIVMVSGLILMLCICACKSDNVLELLKAVLPILSGILSFIGGRLTR